MATPTRHKITPSGSRRFPWRLVILSPGGLGLINWKVRTKQAADNLALAHSDAELWTYYVTDKHFDDIDRT